MKQRKIKINGDTKQHILTTAPGTNEFK